MSLNFVHQMSHEMKYANSVDPDQTAPEGTVCLVSTLFARNNCIKSKINWGKESME